MARVQTPSHMQREYECVYLVRPELEDPVIDRVVQKYRDIVAEQGGKVTKIDNWGKRRLAYLIDKQQKATYIYMQFLGTSGLVAEMERNMRISDDIVRWLTVVLDDSVDPEARPEASEVTRRVVEEEDEMGARSRGRSDRDDEESGPRGRGRPDRDEGSRGSEETEED